jgi:hypothetical protein
MATEAIMSVPAAFSGGCLCGAVRYECSAAPMTMVNCHCRDCQKAGGSGYSPTVVVRRRALRLRSGRPRYHRVTGESGSIARRAFCPECGTPLFASTSARPGLLGIRAGSLDDPSWFRATADVWTSSAQPWALMDSGVPKFRKGRPARPGERIQPPRKRAGRR